VPAPEAGHVLEAPDDVIPADGPEQEHIEAESGGAHVAVSEDAVDGIAQGEFGVGDRYGPEAPVPIRYARVPTHSALAASLRPSTAGEPYIRRTRC
jgi:hypothetical protein